MGITSVARSAEAGLPRILPRVLLGGLVDGGGELAVMNHAIVQRLRDHHLRPTRQRVALAHLIFRDAPCHLSAETLAQQAESAGIRLSLATIYNTLRQFTEAGLLREIKGIGDVTWFDTNTDDHHHFFDVESENLMDIPAAGVKISSLPVPPKGYDVESVHVMVKIAPRSGRGRKKTAQ